MLSFVSSLRVAFTRPQTYLSILLVLLVCLITGFSARSNTNYEHWSDYFISFFDWIGLLFPLTVALLTQLLLLDEWDNTYVMQVRTRVNIGAYFRHKVITAATTAFIVFTLLILLILGIANLTFIQGEINTDPYKPLEQRHDLSQIAGISIPLYIIVFALWVGLIAAILAVICTLATACIENKFLALIAPFIGWQAVQIIIAYARIEKFALPPFRSQVCPTAPVDKSSANRSPRPSCCRNVHLRRSQTLPHPGNYPLVILRLSKAIIM